MRTEQTQPQRSETASSDLSLPADLVHAIRHGNTHAEAELVRKYERGLHFLVWHHTDDHQLAEDVVQETFIVVIQRLRTTGLDEPAKLSPFMHRAARNIMIGHLRKAARRRTSADTNQVECAIGSLEEQYRVAARDQDALIVRQLLAELNCDRDRQILKRFYLLEEEKTDICNDLELSAVHFNRVLYRARQRFAALVEEFERKEDVQLLCGRMRG